MTVLENSIRINATPEQVWSVLGTLDALDQYDPGVKHSVVIDGAREGVGASRKCELAPSGWFRERVTEWTPKSSLAFELTACNLPVKMLRHSYRIHVEGNETIVTQRMEYELKFGPIGKLMDVVMVRNKWNNGIQGFFAGLKRHVEQAST